ncbi:uncharacterized protein P884DRAFT_279034 [Thermothelomyces heterothallicus CBS 202.75]|uniref:uncharacterized protein n=1 Tax=Thermothelomyces heterothallicus CBS 202.75 TaxID=1149848 RepID=UPI00374415A0
MCGTKISYACMTTLISQSITCSCERVVACGKSTLFCGTCSHPRCKELRGEVQQPLPQRLSSSLR